MILCFSNTGSWDGDNVGYIGSISTTDQLNFGEREAINRFVMNDGQLTQADLDEFAFVEGTTDHHTVNFDQIYDIMELSVYVQPDFHCIMFTDDTLYGFIRMGC